MFKKRYIRVPIYLLAACLLLLLIIWAAAGPIAKPQVVKWLKSQGAESATIQSIILNPFRPSLQLKELAVNADKGKPLFLERVYVRLSWLGLLRKQLHVRQVEVQALELKVDQSADQLTIGGLAPSTGRESKPPAEKTSEKTVWRLRLDDLVISSSRVDVAIPNFSGTLTLDKARCHKGLLGSDAATATLDVKGRINKAPLLANLQLDFQKDKGTVKGDLDLKQLALADFHPLIADTISRLQGNLSIQTQWQMDIQGPAIALDQTVHLQLADLAAETDEMILGQKQGGVQIDLTANTQGQKFEKAHIKRLAVNDAHLDLVLKKKQPAQAPQASSEPPGPGDDQTDNKSEPQPPAAGVQIDLVEVTGDTRIAFSDQNLDPAFSEVLRHFNFKITDLDNRKAEKASPFSMNAEIQKYGKLDVNGTLKPFSQNLFVDLTGRISEYGLPPVSGYTQDMLGYHIRTGQLNADLALKIENRILDGQTALDLKALKLIPAEGTATEKLTKQVTMPLDLALGYISDDKGNLELKMPIKGSLDDPEFGIEHLCQIVMVKAAKSAAYSYLKTMLLPYGSLVQFGVGVAVKAGQKMMSLKLAPLVYPPGQLQPGPESKTYMDQLVALMTKESDMRLIVCSVATPADWVAPKGKKKVSQTEKEKQLLALAKARMDHFKQLLIETHGIESHRLLDCYPRVDDDPEGQPRIEIDL